MTAFDSLIEPVAIQAGWWAWEGVHVPWFNYASWWGISFMCFTCSPGSGEKTSGRDCLLPSLYSSSFF